MSGDESDFDDAVLANELSGASSAASVLLAKKTEEEDRLTAAEILEGLRALDVGGDGVRWAIARVGDPDPNKNGHLVTWATSQLDADTIRDQFGGGKYYVKGRRNNGDYAGHKTITIAGDAPRRDVPNAQLSSISGGGSNQVVSEFITAQERRDRERQEREDKRAADRERLILAALPAAATVFAAMFSRPQVDVAGLAAALRPAPAPDPMVAIAALKQLLPSAPAGPSPMEQSLQLVELMLDRAGGSDKTTLLDVVKEGVKIMGPTLSGMAEQAIQQAQQARANAQAQQTAPPGMSVEVHPTALPSSGNAPPQVVEESMLDLIPHVAWLQARLGELVAAAARGRDPQLYAAMFLEKLTETTLPAARVLELLSRSDWLTQLARFDARIAEQPVTWWNDLHRDLVGMIQEAIVPPSTTPAAVNRPQPARRVVKESPEMDRPQGLPSLTGDPQT